MDQPINFVKVFPPPSSSSYGKESVWLNSSHVSKIEYPVDPNGQIESLQIVWAGGDASFPFVPSRLVRFRVGKEVDRFGQTFIGVADSYVLINPAAVWVIQSHLNATRLYFTQDTTSSILKPENGTVVVILGNENGRQAESTPIRVAEALGIALD